MTGDLLELVVFLAVAAAVVTAGVAFCIFFVAPRISRLADRNDEEPGDGDD